MQTAVNAKNAFIRNTTKILHFIALYCIIFTWKCCSTADKNKCSVTHCRFFFTRDMENHSTCQKVAIRINALRHVIANWTVQGEYLIGLKKTVHVNTLIEKQPLCPRQQLHSSTGSASSSEVNHSSIIRPRCGGSHISSMFCKSDYTWLQSLCRRLCTQFDGVEQIFLQSVLTFGHSLNMWFSDRQTLQTEKPLKATH